MNMKFAKKSKSEKIKTTSEGVAIQKKKKKTRLWPKVIVGLLLLLVLGGVAFAGNVYLNLRKVVSTKSGISAEGLKGDIDLSKLKGEGDGRVNILLLGTGDVGHAGQDLTDTMIVASIDPKSNDVVMLGIPRDLYVRVPGYGWNKINSAYALAEQYKAGSGAEIIKKTISDIIDQPIQYYSKVDFTGLRLAVDKLGGINVYNPEDLRDPEYPCDKNENYSCGFNLKSGYYKMDGTLALKYARCRKGTCGDDYGRAKRQQGVVVGMRDQALQLGNILNPAKVSELIGIVGDHLKTDLSIDELKRLSDIGRKINSNSSFKGQ
jgi:LCP family protein required for cell wall assembly